jgi:hypothetical protein
MKRLTLTVGFYLSIETKKSYRAKSGRFELPSLADFLPAGLQAAIRRLAQDARRIARQGEVTLALLGIAGRSLAWGLAS